MRALLLGSLALPLLLGACKRAPSPLAAHSSAATESARPAGFKPVPAVPLSAAAPVASDLARAQKPWLSLVVSPTDLRLEPMYTGTHAFSYAAWAKASSEPELALLEQDQPGARKTCLREIKVTPIAWQSPLLSIKEEIYQSCPDLEAHPGGETRLTTLALDLGPHAIGPPRPGLLTDFFEPAVLFRALRADPIVAKALTGRESPADLPSLISALVESSPAITDGHCYSFPDDLLARFVLHHREASSIAIHVGLPGAGPCRYALTELPLLLPIPPVLQRPLDVASRDPSSFFAPTAPQLVAEIHLGPAK